MNEGMQRAVKGGPIFSARPVRRDLLQRKCACGGSGGPSGECAECKKKRMNLQRHPAGHATPAAAPPIVHEVLRSSGQPLDAGTRAFFEPQFGHDFSRVRVHTDEKAAQSAQAVNALAYTVGRDVVFGAGLYLPTTAEGKRLLAHELTHVVQQGEAGAGGALSLVNANHSSESEADAIADQVTMGAHVAASHGMPFAVQRQQKTNQPSPTQPVDYLTHPTLQTITIDRQGRYAWPPGATLTGLAAKAVDALSGSPNAYIRVTGRYAKESTFLDKEGLLYEKSDTLRKALIQWIGPGKFANEDKRFDVYVGETTETLLPAGAVGEIEVSVEYSSAKVAGVVAGPEATQVGAGAPPPGGPSTSAKPYPLFGSAGVTVNPLAAPPQGSARASRTVETWVALTYELKSGGRGSLQFTGKVHIGPNGLELAEVVAKAKEELVKEALWGVVRDLNVSVSVDPGVYFDTSLPGDVNSSEFKTKLKAALAAKLGIPGTPLELNLSVAGYCYAGGKCGGEVKGGITLFRF